jgi:hypothetical protein
MQKTVGAGMGDVFGIWVDAKPVGARLAGDGDFMGAIASKPAPTDWGMFSGFGLTQYL